MISGFVILMSAYSSTIPKFLISRFTRLYPTFWAGVFLTSIVSYFIGTEHFKVESMQVLLNLTMIPTVFGAQNVDGVYWTLLVELKFYMLILILLAFNLIKQIKVIALLWLSWSIVSFYYHTSDTINGIIFPSFSSYFVAGSIFFLIKNEGQSLFKFFVIFLSFVSSSIYALKYIQHQADHFNTEFSGLIVISVISLFYIIFYLISIEKEYFLIQKFYII